MGTRWPRELAKMSRGQVEARIAEYMALEHGEFRRRQEAVAATCRELFHRAYRMTLDADGQLQLSNAQVEVDLFAEAAVRSVNPSSAVDVDVTRYRIGG